MVFEIPLGSSCVWVVVWLRVLVYQMGTHALAQVAIDIDRDLDAGVSKSAL